MPYSPFSGTGEADSPYHIPNPDPARKYRWLSIDIKRLGAWTNSFGQYPGYALEKGTTVEETRKLARKLGLGDGYVNEAMNRIQYADATLASIPMEEHKRRQAERDSMNRDIQHAADNSFLGTDIKGVKPWKREVEEVMDRKAHAERDSNNRVGYTGKTT